MATIEQAGERVGRRRRRARIAGRVAGVAALILAVAYATLPYWLPRSWLAQRFADVLSADLHRAVTIGRVDISWQQGITFRDIHISDQQVGNRVLATIGAINTEFSPLTTLLSGEVAQVQFERAEVFLAVDEAGRLNVADLGERRGGRLPSMRYLVRGLCVHLRTPSGSAEFPLDTAECLLDQATGVVEVFVQAPGSRNVSSQADTDRLADRESGIRCHARVQVPRLKKGTELGGSVELAWRDMNLADLPWDIGWHLPIAQVSGACSGELTIATRPDLGMDFDFQIALAGVAFTRRDIPGAAQVPDAEIRCQGHWDPSADLLTLQDVDYRSPALHVGRVTQSDEPAVLLDPRGEIALAMQLEGEVCDWQLLGREIPDAALLSRSLDLDLSGQSKFRVDCSRRLGSDKLTLVLDAEQSTWLGGVAQPYWLQAGPGIAKRLQVALDRSGSRTGGQLQLSLGPVSVSAGTSFSSPGNAETAGDLAQMLLDTLPALQVQSQIEISRLEELSAIFPILAGGAVEQWQGPFFAKAALVPSVDASRMELQLHLAADTVLEWGELFHKSAGDPMSVNAGISIPHDLGGNLLDPQLEVNYRQAQCRIDGKSSRMQYAFGFLNEQPDSPIEFEGHASLPMRVSQIEDLLACSPTIQQAYIQQAERAVEGSVNLNLHADLFARAGEWLVQSGIEVLADEIDIRWDDAFRKPAGEKLLLAAEHHWQVGAGRQVQTIGATASQPSGEIVAGLCFASGDTLEMGEEFEQSTLRAEIADLNGVLQLFPQWRDRLARWNLSDAFRLQVATLSHDGRQTMSVGADASNAGFAIPSTELLKPPGVPVNGQFRWQRRTSGKDDVQIWKLTDASGQFAGADLTELAGTITLDAPAAGTSTRHMLLTHGRPILRGAMFHARGALEMEEPLLRLSPELSKWRDELQLAGPVVCEGDFEYGPDRLAFSAQLDATQVRCRRALDSRIAPEFRKEAGLPLWLAVDVSLADWQQGGPARAVLDNLLITVDGNSVQAWGEWPLSSSGQQTAAPALGLWMRLGHPDRLTALVPGLWLEQVAGQAQLRATVGQDEQGGWSLEQANAVLEKLSLGVKDEPVELNGELDFADGQIRTNNLSWDWGTSSGSLAGHLRQENGELDGQWSVACDNLDIIQLQRLVDGVQLPESAAPASPADTPNPARLIVDLLRRSQLRIDAQVKNLLVTLPPEIPVRAEAVGQQLTVDRGQVNLAFNAYVEGGLVTGTVTSAMQEQEPTYHLQYKASRIPPGPLTEAYLQRLFPGMKGTGPLTLIDESVQSIPVDGGVPPAPTGKGELIIEGGTVEGRAAPLWMTRFFPGLNLALFEFSYMHSWFDKTADGRVRHQMIYQGKYYNIYSSGYGDAEGNIDYEVGIDFLADFDSKYWAESGQGRVPLFRKTGQVDDKGVLQNETVVYVPRKFIEGVLVKNNPVVTAYHAVRKRVLGRQ